MISPSAILSGGLPASRRGAPSAPLGDLITSGVHDVLMHVPELEGIIYPSSLTDAPCCVLFVDDKNCVDAGQAAAGREGTQLVLTGTTEVGP